MSTLLNARDGRLFETALKADRPAKDLFDTEHVGLAASSKSAVR
jgi:hypothetical protein